MNAGTRRRLAALGATGAIVGAAVIVSACAAGSRTGETQTVPRHTSLTRAGADQASLPLRAAVLRVGLPLGGDPIPPGFVGLSIEYSALHAYAGTNPSALNAVFVQLLRNLAPGQSPVLRIGGDSTDLTWWPVPGLQRPAGIQYRLTVDDVRVLHSLAGMLGARLILGINLEADSSRVAAGEARVLVDGIGENHVAGLELGNEPELYGVFKWDGSGRKGRAPGYDFTDYNQDVRRIGDALTMAPLAGPAVGAPKWFPDLRRFLSSHPRVAVATLHRYPLQRCYVHPTEPNYPTIAHLLSASSSRSLANSVAHYVGVAHGHGIPLRVDEMNTNSCGQDRGVSQSFASALWAIDALFEMARVGVDGVNVHSYPGAVYQLFRFSASHGIWRAVVAPEYYGLLTFARAAPAGSRLLRVGETRGAGLKAWATRAPDGTVHLVAINEAARGRTVAVRPGSARSDAVLERLEAPRLTSSAGVRLAGQSFGSSSSTGLLAGRQRTLAVAPQGGVYVFNVPAGSAALLTIPPA